MNTFVTLVGGFILTGVLANWLIQSWQHRNWLRQQRFLGAEKDYEALKAISEEISKLAAKRLWMMRSLLRTLSEKSNREAIDAARKEYATVVSEWNEKLNVFFVKLAMYAGWRHTKYLEDQIQVAFRSSGRHLERLARRALAGEDIQTQAAIDLNDRFNILQGMIGEFNTDLLRKLQEQQAKTYHGIKIDFKPDALELFPTWQLIKALFVNRVERISVIRSPSDLGKPLVSRD